MRGLIYLTTTFITLTWVYYFISWTAVKLLTHLPDAVMETRDTGMRSIITISGILVNAVTVGMILGFDNTTFSDNCNLITRFLVVSNGVLHLMISVVGLGILVNLGGRVKFISFIRYMYLNTVLGAIYLILLSVGYLHTLN